MDFKLDEAELRAIQATPRQANAQIEEEADCDISAGADWSVRSPYSQHPINHEKLIALLQDELGEVLSLEELEDMALKVQEQARCRVMEKTHSGDNHPA